MIQSTPREKRNDKIGMATSIVVHLLFLLIAFLMVTCYKSPGPPNRMSDIGVIVDMGSSDFGSSNLKSDADPNDVTEETEEVVEESSESEPVDAVEAPIENDVEEVADVTDAIPEAVTKTESPIAVAKETRTAPKPVENKPKENTKPNTKPVVDPKPKPTETGNPKPNNNGDTPDKMGDKGSPTSVDSSLLYKNPGGGTDGTKGADGSFNASIGGGWKAVGQPVEKRIKHSGIIELSFVVDEYGDMSRITVISSGFTQQEEKILIDRIKNELSFERTSGSRPPEQSQGKITWKFKAQ